MNPINPINPEVKRKDWPEWKVPYQREYGPENKKSHVECPDDHICPRCHGHWAKTQDGLHDIGGEKHKIGL